MGVVVHFGFMGRMLMVMGSMLTGMVMIMHVGILGMAVFMRMFVDVFVNMGVGVLVGVNHVPVGVRMAMNMGVFMGMQVAVFVFPFHAEVLPSEKLQVFHKPIDSTIILLITSVNNHRRSAPDSGSPYFRPSGIESRRVMRQ